MPSPAVERVQGSVDWLSGFGSQSLMKWGAATLVTVADQDVNLKSIRWVVGGFPLHGVDQKWLNDLGVPILVLTKVLTLRLAR